MRNRRPGEVAPEVVRAVWEAEDGRCEACTRPMDKRCARVTRVDDTRAHVKTCGNPFQQVKISGGGARRALAVHEGDPVED